MAQLLAAIGSAIDLRDSAIESLELNVWNRKFMLKSMQEPLFKKPEPQETEGALQQSVTTQEIKDVEGNIIDINDFTKVHLVVGTITECKELPNSDKLLILQVNCGSHGKRQILSGIKKYFKPGDLINKQGVFVLNLKPRKMAGLESQGMMLLAEDNEGIPQRVTVEQLVPDGTRLK
jgi:methionyl-tRNA synthetase